VKEVPSGRWVSFQRLWTVRSADESAFGL